MNKSYLNRIGEKHSILQGYEVEIVEYRGCYDVDVKTNNGNIFTVQYGHLIKGKVKNPYHPFIWGVGFLGVGRYKSKVGGKSAKAYITWRNMLERAYSEEYHTKSPAYKDVTVCTEWHNFQNFAQWYNENWKEYMEGWHIDKDILIKGNKVYSPETCCLVPNEINSFFVKGKSRRGCYLIGVSKNYGKFMVSCNFDKKIKNLGYFDSELEAFQVYKNFKENLAKKLANKWQEQITEDVYNVVYNYKVEIYD